MNIKKKWVYLKWFKNSGKKETDEYEKEYLARYDKQREPKQKKKILKNKKDEEMVSDKKNQVKIGNKESDPLSVKFKSVKDEYNILIKNLMDAKKELKNINENVQNTNSEYNDIISKTKSARVELLKVNSELQEKTENNGKIEDEYKKQKILIQETNYSKKELSKIKDEIMKCNKELESVRTNVGNSPDIKKLKEERKKIENEINKKRIELESGFRELKFIKDEMAKSSKSEGTEKIVDAASAVVASMNQKLQTTLTELDAVKKALENERSQRKNSA